MIDDCRECRCMTIMEIRTRELRRMSKAAEWGRAVQIGRTAKRVQRILTVLGRRVQDSLIHVETMTGRSGSWQMTYR